MKVLKISWQRSGLLALFLISLIGCRPLSYLGLAMPPVTTIQSVSSQNPGASIYLQGKVMTQAPFLQGGAYQLQDATGTIWIVTNRPLPSLGEEILIKGQVQYEAIAVGNQQLGEFYILEVEHFASANLNQPQPSPVVQPTPQPSLNLIGDDQFLPHKRNYK